MVFQATRPRRLLQAAIAAAIASMASSAKAQITLLNSFGSSGSGNGQLSEPTGISVDPGAGTVYVADSFNNRIESFTATGSFVSTLGSVGQAAGQFAEPNGVSFNPTNGFLAVADSGNSRVQIFQSGLPVPLSIIGSPGTATNQFHSPEGVEYLSDTLVVADSSNNRISIFKSDGTYVGGENGVENSKPMNHPDGMAYDALTNSFYVVDTGNNVIQEYAGLVGDSDGIFGSAGSANGQFNIPDAVAATNGRFYVADELNNRIQIFNVNNAFVASFSVPTPQGVTVNSNGLVYVTTGDTVKRFFDPAAWTAGANSFTNSAVSPTSVAVGPSQILGTQLTLTSAKGLVVGGTTSVVAGGTLTLSGGSFSTGSLTVSGGGILSATAGGSFSCSNLLNINDAGSQVVLDGGAAVTTSAVSIGGGLLKVGNATVNANGGFGFAPQLFMSSGELQLNNSANAIVSGVLFNTSGLIDGSGGQVQATVLNAGTITSAVSGGSFTFTGSANSSTGMILISNGTLHFSHDLSNTSGTISMSGGDFLIDGGLSTGGDFEMAGNSQVFGPVVNTSAGLVHTIGVSNAFHSAFTNNGTVNCASGVLAFLGGYTGPGGVGGSGRITLDQSVSTGAAPATVSFAGNVVMQPTMTLHMRLVGATPDKIAITGTGTLGGTMSIESYSGLPPLPGQSFQAISFGSHVGDIVLSNNTGFTGLRFAKSFSSSALTIQVSGLSGDTNLDGTVGTPDFAMLAAHFNGASTNWLSGDFNGDGRTNALDFNILATNFGMVLPAPPALGIAVPEPVLAFACLWPLVGVGRRSRRRAG